MAKDYINNVVDLTGDSYLNPTPAVYNNGVHNRNVSQITSISVHHDAMNRPHDYDSAARYRAEAAHHYQILGPGLQYHYKIDNTGVIFKIRPHEEWLYVVGSAENVSCLAICLDGYLHNDSTNQGQDPTREQYEALAQLLENLCEQHPEFPATWPDVRPHLSYSSTACCGNRFAPFITAINSKADANNIPNVPYDWPELQPSTPPAPAPAPQPTPPTPPTVTINYRVFADGKQVGAYTVDANAWNKYKATPGSVIKDQNGNDVTAQLTAKFAPPAPPTPAPADQAHDYSQENNGLLKQILALVQWIVDKLKGVFK